MSLFKMFRLLLTILFVLFLTFTSVLAQWIKQTNGLPDDLSGLAIDACDSNTALISIRNVTLRQLFMTKDAGNTWFEITWPYSNLYDEVVDISMIDTSNIWICANHKIFTTYDGGENWTMQFSDSTRTEYLNYIEMFDLKNGVALGDAILRTGIFNSVHFINESQGWAVGNLYDDFDLNGKNYKIYSTTNGGETWIPQISPETKSLKSVYFIGSDTGWAVGSPGTILKTTDGGANWIALTSLAAKWLNSVYFLNSNIGWVAGNTILKTTTGGESWINQTGEMDDNFRSICFVDQNIGWAVGVRDSIGVNDSIKIIIIKTTDGGETWVHQNPGTTNRLYSIYFADQNIGWAVGLGGIILHTKNGGIDWEVQNSGTSASLWSVYFINDSIGWICGDAGTILKTNDGSKSWTTQYVDYSANFESIYFVNSNVGWVVGSNSLIMKTIDGGLNWKFQFGEKPKPALVLKTSDGGVNWIDINDSCLLNAFSNRDWRRIDFVNSNVGYFYASMDYGHITNPRNIFKTVDGGKTWTLNNFPSCAEIIKFYDEYLGIAGDSKHYPERAGIFRTNDGGNTWVTIEQEIPGRISDIEFIPGDPSKVWMTTYDKLYFSSDKGKTWNVQLPNCIGFDMVFVNNKNGWILARSGVYHTTNGGLPPVNSEVQEIPTRFDLFQNHPNPFNSITTLKFSIDKASHVRLKIYNAMGQEVNELFHKEFGPGNYIVQWDGKNNFGQPVSSGLYFAKLVSTNQSKLKKMLLIR